MRTEIAKLREIMNDWEVTRDAHVIPRDDLKDHINDLACWCAPTEDDGAIVHHSLDQRETYEQGRQLQ